MTKKEDAYVDIVQRKVWLSQNVIHSECDPIKTMILQDWDTVTIDGVGFKGVNPTIHPTVQYVYIDMFKEYEDPSQKNIKLNTNY